MERADLPSGTPQPNLPPGFRFHPTDEELVVHYLKKKAATAPLPVAIIAEVDLYKFDPWELPAKATFGEQEWYFFSPRDRKYPNGARPNRAATSGYWKATGTDKPVLTAGGTQKVGVKKALVFYGGKPPKGIKTNWIMHEYRLIDNKVNNKPPGCDLGSKKNSLRLDDWVLCRIYKKSNTTRPADHDKEDSMEHILGSIPPSLQIGSQLPKATATNFGDFLAPADHTIMFEGMLANDSAISHLTSATAKAAIPMAPATATSTSNINILPFRKTLPPASWNEEDSPAISPTKRFHPDTSEGSITRTDENNTSSHSITSFLTQVPPTPPLHHQTMVGEGVLRSPYLFPGINWYT